MNRNDQIPKELNTMRAVLAGILLLILLVLFFFPELLTNDALAAVVALAGVAGIVLSAAALRVTYNFLRTLTAA